jgi:hypothetical protein
VLVRGRDDQVGKRANPQPDDTSVSAPRALLVHLVPEELAHLVAKGPAKFAGKREQQRGVRPLAP